MVSVVVVFCRLLGGVDVIVDDIVWILATLQGDDSKNAANRNEMELEERVCTKHKVFDE